MKKLRGAVVGYGFIMDKGHVAAYRQRADVELVAIADVSAERRAAAAAAWPNARVYADHGALFAAEAGRLDFVDIATPPSDHAAVTHAALDAGLHVLCEKPLAATIDEARAMLRHATRAERVIYPCHNYKHAPVIKAVRGVIESGRIGKVHLVTLQTFRDTHAKGVPGWRTDWRRERRYSGGGIAMDHGSHTFYLAFEWLRAYPTAITARSVAMGPYDTEDDFSCSLRFPTGVASAHLSWNAGVRKVMYTLHGDRGAIRVEDDDIEVAVRERTPGQRDRAGDQFLAFRAGGDIVGLDGFQPRHLVQLAVRRFQGGDRAQGVRRPRGGRGVPVRAADLDGLRVGARGQPRAAARRAGRAGG